MDVSEQQMLREMLNSYLQMHKSTEQRVDRVKAKRCPKGSRVCKTGQKCPGPEFAFSPGIYTPSGQCFSKEALREPEDVQASRVKMLQMLELGARLMTSFDDKLKKYVCSGADKDTCGMDKTCKWANEKCTIK